MKRRRRRNTRSQNTPEGNFQELQRNGLIEIIPNWETRVVTWHTALTRYDRLCRELEGLAAELAAFNIQPEQFDRLRRLLESASRVKPTP